MDKKKKIQMIAGVIVFLVCGVLYLSMSSGQKENTTVTEHFADSGEKGQQEGTTPKTTTDKSDQGTEKTPVYIHICGAVRKPGVYTFAKEPHGIDVVKRAGGFTKKADKTSVNLAELVTDGTQLVIAVKDSKKAPTDKQSSGYKSDSHRADCVNINTATEQELMTLSGIGESKASQIVSYRTAHGAFHKIEDIMNISGIKEGVFSKIKDYITV